MWEGVGDRTEQKHIDPHSYGHQRCVFLVLHCCSTGGPGAQLSAECCFHYSIISTTLLIPKLVWPPKTLWSPNWLTSCLTELYNSSIAHSISPHNWPLECVTSAVFGMACLIVIERKLLSCSSQVTLFRCICLWLHRAILTLSHIVSQARPRQWNRHFCRLWNGMFGGVGSQYTTLDQSL